MMKKLFKLFDTFMIKHQRKLTLVDTFGNEIMHRYCILRKEDPKSAIKNPSKWPAFYLHNFIWENSPDGPSSHSHVGTTLSWVLKGQYWERFGDEIIHRKRWSFNRVKFGDIHKIERVESGTWSIFIRWFSKSEDVRIVPETCETICDYCKDKYGQCFNVGKEFDHDLYSKQFDSTSSAIKFPEFHVAGPETDIFIQKRKRAMQRLGIEAPKTSEDQLAFARKYSKLPVIYEELQNEKK
jgi:hypothetical protein